MNKSGGNTAFYLSIFLQNVLTILSTCAIIILSAEADELQTLRR